METSEDLYSFFIQALRHFIDNGGHGAQKVLSIDSGVSKSMLSQILSERSPRKASMDSQVRLAGACGYSYEEFIDIGRKLTKGEPVNITKEDSGTTQTRTSNDLGGDNMPVETDRTNKLLDHYAAELEYLRSEVEKLRKEKEVLERRLEVREEAESQPQGEEKKRTM